MAEHLSTIPTKPKTESTWQCISQSVNTYLICSGALEPQFYAELIKGLELKLDEIPSRMDPSNWHELKEIFTRKFMEKNQKEWERIFDGTDSCVTPVIPMSTEDNRPIAGLSGSPGLDVTDPKTEALLPGAGMEEALGSWMGWVKGREYTVDSKGTARVAGSSKL
jgi:alpha-methylacyl-CoA racemase